MSEDAVLPQPRRPLVSILIPAYNPRYFPFALDSALAQTYPAIEVVVCDDCPTDAIQAIASTYAGDSRVRYCRNERNLCRENYVKCFLLARGEYIKFLNDDDALKPDCVSRMVEILEHHPDVTLVTSHRQRIDAAGAELPDDATTARVVGEDSVIDGMSAIACVLGWRLNFIGEPSTAMFRRRDADAQPDLMSLNGQKVPWNVDVALYANLLAKGALAYLTETLSSYRSHPEQQQKGPDNAKYTGIAWTMMREFAVRRGMQWSESPSLLARPLNSLTRPVAAPRANCEPAGSGWTVREQALQLRVYWRVGNGYEESAYSSAPLAAGAGSRVHSFPIPAEGQGPLRLVLGPRPAYWTFDALSLRTGAEPSQTLAIANHENGFAGLSASAAAVPLPGTTRFAVYGAQSESEVFLETPAHDDGQPWRLDVRCEAGYQRGDDRDARDAARAALEETAAVRQVAASAANAVEAARAEMAVKSSELAGVRLDLEARTRELECRATNARADAEQQRRRADALQQAVTGAAIEMETQRRALAALAETAREAEDRCVRLAARTGHATRLVESLLAAELELNRLSYSSVWNVMEGVRVLMTEWREMFKSPRRLAGAMYRLVTLQWSLTFRQQKTSRAIAESALFDPVFYLARYTDVAAAKVNPLAHFVRCGAAEGRCPNPLFDTRYYLRENPDVAAARMNPLEHYIRFGAREGRRPNAHFDSAYYLKENPDVAAAGMNPLAHFLRSGGAEGRRPNSGFDSAAYLRSHPAAAAAGVNPLAHFLGSLSDGAADAAASAVHIPRRFVARHCLVWQVGALWVRGDTASCLQQAGPLEPCRLLPAAPVEFSWVAPGERIRELGICVSNFGRRATCHWEVAIYAAPGGTTPVFRQTYAGADAGDLAYHRVTLSGVRFETGRRYEVTVTSADATEENCLAVMGRPMPAGGVQYACTLDAAAEFPFDARSTHVDASRSEGAMRVTVAVPPGRTDSAGVRGYLSRRFPDIVFKYITLDSVRQALSLQHEDAIFFVDPPRVLEGIGDFDELAFALHNAGVCTVYVDSGSFPPLAPDAHERLAGTAKTLQARKRLLARRCHYQLSLPDGGSAAWQADVAPAVGAPLSAICAATRARSRPHVAIVSILHQKAEVIASFLRSVYRQSYTGTITVVLVDDCSPDQSAAEVERFVAQASGQAPHVTVRVVRNPANLGNCASRNRGLAAVEADIYVVVDCDCLLNRDFVAAHVYEHSFEPAEVVIGPFNIESGDRDADAVVAALESDPVQVEKEMKLQDDIQRNGFLNCITRNFSIKRRTMGDEPLFDEDFSYSRKPGSGFGWEDVEMGYRLYAKGSHIAYTRHAFSVHRSHPSAMEEARKVRASARNFNLLFVKHPELALAARRWVLRTAEELAAWARNAGVTEENDPNLKALAERFKAAAVQSAPFVKAWRGGERRLRVLSYRWHVPHQYELYKLPHDFTLVTGLGLDFADIWSHDQRPLRPNVRMAPVNGIRPSDFDLAILHFDETVLNPELCNNTIPYGWGNPFRWLLETVDLPKVAICHGTPPFVGQYGLDTEPRRVFEVHEADKQRLISVLKDIPVVVNSHQALDEWRFPRSRVIWHGFDPQEFPPATYERDVLSHGADHNRPHYRGLAEFQRVRELLGQDVRIDSENHAGVGLLPRESNRYAVANFRAYVDHIRSYTVYLNTTLRSPMPRSRGEAMMCGVVPVSLRTHDVEHFIRNGVNGFYSDSPDELADYVRHLCRDRAAARKIGAQARLTAMDVFNHDRYLTEWTKLLRELTG